MASLVALGAGIAALTGIGAGIGIGIATGKAAEAGSRKQDQQEPAAGRRPGRRHRHFRLRCCPAHHPVPGLITEA